MNTRDQQPIIVTMGEPAGIGPDIILMALKNSFASPIVVIGDREVLEERAKVLHISHEFRDYSSATALPPHKESAPFWCWHVPMHTRVQPGQPHPDNATAILEMLALATQTCLSKQCQAVVTAPINKRIINDAGIAFTGHTEYLAELSHTKKTVMLLMTQQMKVALLTTHIPLAKVPHAVTTEALEECIEIIAADLQKNFGRPHPKILVCGLNPHAGEGGYIGDEEQNIIIPTLAKLTKRDFDVTGPVSADTAFLQDQCATYDVILALYHDQGLPVLKYQGFDHAVNVTLGLPFVRTSVDHGTAENIAGTGKASPNSLIAAIHLAGELANTRSQHVHSSA